MKNILLASALVLSLAETASADWRTTYYAQCAITKRYGCTGKIKPPGKLTYFDIYDRGCTYADVNMTSYDVNQVANMAGVHVRCDAADINYRNGWANTSLGWAWGENVDYETPNYSFAPMYRNDLTTDVDIKNYTGATLNDEGVIFNEKNNSISIKNMNGFLKVSTEDLKNTFSTFQINVFTFKMVGDNAVPVKTLWKAKATIVNGELLLEGNFSASDFTNTSTENNKMFSIDGVSKEILIDKSISMENVSVEVSGDGGNFGIGVSNTYAPDLSTKEGQQIIKNIEAKTELNFDVINTTEKVNVFVTKNTGGKVIEEISILNLNGTTVKSRKVSIDEKNNFELATYDMPKGVYLVVLRSGSEYFSKKIIK